MPSPSKNVDLRSFAAFRQKGVSFQSISGLFAEFCRFSANWVKTRKKGRNGFEIMKNDAVTPL